MTVTTIQTAIVKVEEYLYNQLEAGPRPDIRATAVVENGLRCCIRSPDGKAIHTDMPGAVGGTATANSPSWHLRAAIASCDATLLAMRAARLGIALETMSMQCRTAAACFWIKAFHLDHPGYAFISGSVQRESPRRNCKSWLTGLKPIHQWAPI